MATVGYRDDNGAIQIEPVDADLAAKLIEEMQKRDADPRADA